MGKFDLEFLENELKKYNPWWENPSIFAEDISLPKRDIYQTITNKFFNTQLIIAIVGLRRVGKTTLLKQLINELLLKTNKKKTITYFSFEESILKDDEKIIEKIILYQIKKYPKEKIYFFFDEIQYVNFWNSILKKYFDQFSSQIKFIISGSSSLFIRTTAKESLAGRILEFQIPPLSYGEYFKINKNIILPQGKLFQVNIFKKYQEILKENFSEYLNFGEFPYLKKLSDYNDKKQYLNDWVIGKVVEIDLPRLKKIYHPEELVNLNNVLITGSGSLIQIQNLAYDLGIDRKTLSNYLTLLEKSYLIKTIYNFSGSFRSQSLRQRKIFSSSINAVAFKNTSGVNSESFNLKVGQLVENYVLNYLLKNNPEEIYFWRLREKEIDFIIKSPEKLIPIEVKYQTQIRPTDLKNLIYFCHKKKINEAFVVVKDVFENKTIKGILFHFVPAYFLV